MKPSLAILVTALSLTSTLAVSAQEVREKAGHDPVYVLPPQQPTEVRVGLYLIDVTAISPASSAFPTFEVELFMDLLWLDPRLAFDPGQLGVDRKVFEENNAAAKLDRIWWPDLDIENKVKKRNTENLELIIFSDGTVEYKERFNAVIHANFDLRKFPFDKQTLEIDLESFEWDERYVHLVINEKRVGWNHDFQTPEWEITGVSARVRSEKEIRSDVEFSEFIFTIDTVRHATYYIWRTFLPLFLITSVALLLLWKSPGERLGNSVLILLVIVGYHSISAGNLPKLNHLTVMDGLFLIGYVIALIIMIEGVIVERMTLRDDLTANATARKIDAATKWLLPIAGAGAVGGLVGAILVLGL